MGKPKDEVEIDLLQMLKALWHRAWIVVIAAVLCAGMGFSYAAFIKIPMYESEALLYVNNSSISVGSTSFSISPSELTAAQNLVDTYIVILKTRSVLNEVIDKAGLSYSYEQLKSMITAAPVNHTEVFSIKITSPDPHEAERIANTIAEILPDKIADIVDGSSVRIVDYAIVPSFRSSPSVTRYTALGLLFGVVVSCFAIVIFELSDTTIRSEEYLMQNYDFPVLAVIPELAAHKGGKYGYYYNRQPDQNARDGEK